MYCSMQSSLNMSPFVSQISPVYEKVNLCGGSGPAPGCTGTASQTTPKRYTIDPKHRESAVSFPLSLGLSDYADVDVPGQICQYQSLDPVCWRNRSTVHRLHATTSENDWCWYFTGKFVLFLFFSLLFPALLCRISDNGSLSCMQAIEIPVNIVTVSAEGLQCSFGHLLEEARILEFEAIERVFPRVSW